MPRIRMKRDFNFHRTKFSTIYLREGREYRVTTPCAEAAIAADAAEYTELEVRRRRRVAPNAER
jgi:hypothetical protein